MCPVYEGRRPLHHHSFSAATRTEVRSRSPGTTGSSRRPTNGSTQTQRVAPNRAAEAKSDPVARGGRRHHDLEGLEQAPRIAHRRGTHDVGPVLAVLPHAAPERALAAQERPERDAHAGHAVVASLHVGQLVGDDALELNRIEPAEQTRGHDEVRTAGVATERTGVGDVVVEHVERRHGQAEGGAEAVGDVEQPRVVVLLDGHRADPLHRHRRCGAPEAVHEGGPDDDEGDDAEHDVHRHPQQHPDQDRRERPPSGRRCVRPGAGSTPPRPARPGPRPGWGARRRAVRAPEPVQRRPRDARRPARCAGPRPGRDCGRDETGIGSLRRGSLHRPGAGSRSAPSAGRPSPSAALEPAFAPPPPDLPRTGPVAVPVAIAVAVPIALPPPPPEDRRRPTLLAPGSRRRHHPPDERAGVCELSLCSAMERPAYGTPRR